jgi:hypothetical protein
MYPAPLPYNILCCERRDLSPPMNSETLWAESESANDRKSPGVSARNSHDVKKRQDPKDVEAPLVG